MDLNEPPLTNVPSFITELKNVRSWNSFIQMSELIFMHMWKTWISVFCFYLLTKIECPGIGWIRSVIELTCQNVEHILLEIGCLKRWVEIYKMLAKNATKNTYQWTKHEDVFLNLLLFNFDTILQYVVYHHSLLLF